MMYVILTLVEKKMDDAKMQFYAAPSFLLDNKKRDQRLSINKYIIIRIATSCRLELIRTSQRMTIATLLP